MKIFISYTSSDSDWAHWIGWHLLDAQHHPIVHEWEVAWGQNIASWMEEQLSQADQFIGVFSDEYCQAIYSRSERSAAYWLDPAGHKGYLVPIEVRPVTKWPAFVNPLKRLSLIGLGELEAAKELLRILALPQPPQVKPGFPGSLPAPYVRHPRND
jgi:hypothetical protein